MIPIGAPRELLSVSEALKRSGVSNATLYSYIRKGKLSTVKRAGTRIAASELERLTAEKVAA